MIAVNTNVLIYACGRADLRRQKIALDGPPTRQLLTPRCESVLRILHLAATAGEARVVDVLAMVLDQVGGFDYVTVQAQVAPPALTVPVIHIPIPDLSVYDALRAGAAA